MARRRVKRDAMQLTLDDARRPIGHGGWRPGAGRPRGRSSVAHAAREDFAERFPLHVTWRLVDDVASLRREAVLEVVRDACRAIKKRDARVVEFNVLGNHLHLIVEAAGRDALSRGMNGLGTRLARRINKVLGRSGELFRERYHVRVLRTPQEVHNVLRYVLLNARHHADDRGETLAHDWIDPYSSAPWFDGWKDPIRTERPYLRRLRRLDRPTAAAKTWLLAVGWRRHGLLAFDDVPGMKKRRRS
jgi:REP element-mobilizing transposase RayT